MRQSSSKQFAQAGFSLIELMVASVVGLLIMAAILTLYLNIARTNDEMAKTNVLAENGRLAIQLLANDIAHAGFWGGYIPDFDDWTVSTTPTAIPTGIPQPCLAYSSWTSSVRTNRLGIAIQTHSSVPTGCSGVITNQKSNTDILVVRHAETCEAGATGCVSTGVDSKLYFQASRCDDSTVDTSEYVLATSGHNLHERDCTTLAPKRKYVSHLYYVRDYAVTSGDGIPTLVRSEFDLASGAVTAQAPVALIEGVEGFRVELGVDRVSANATDIISDADPDNRYSAAIAWVDSTTKATPVNRGDGAADEFVHCTGSTDCPVDKLVNVVAVKLHLLVRSSASTAGHVDNKTYTLGGQTIAAANDGFKRHVFSTVVRLNNVSSRRATP
ncbi:PilW family protein [Pseudomonas sp. GCM10022188]|uniref:PilW family protein n=1 Tax=Pseudomonas TaxID=286 RepID=UPI001E611F3A|nr:PilW family protein [Pseudomonas oryzagri]MCC6073756.1 PilW family protein [Pseudomonas oryzagri]